jgi:hypothetical protein
MSPLRNFLAPKILSIITYSALFLMTYRMISMLYLFIFSHFFSLLIIIVISLFLLPSWVRLECSSRVIIVCFELISLTAIWLHIKLRSIMLRFSTAFLMSYVFKRICWMTKLVVTRLGLLMAILNSLIINRNFLMLMIVNSTS